MERRDYGPLLIPPLMLVGLCVFLTGIGWGLPSRRADAYLFGDRAVWSSREILALAGDRGAEKLGADVDRDPAAVGDVLNDTDPERAQIVRRYRLFTSSPDEMITMMALAGMKPSEGDFDPGVYRYGGLWVYPVAGLIWLTTSVESEGHYLDHPAQFGWLYVVARLYSAAWGLVGVWVVYRLAVRAGAGVIGSVGAALLYIFLPVVVNQAHEAGPHLAGAVLVLGAALSGGTFVETGRSRWWIAAGAMCGGAMATIVSAAGVFVILPLMVVLRPMAWGRRVRIAAGAIAVGLLVYAVTNPYVLVHMVGDPSVLPSNLRNTSAMGPAGAVGGGVLNALKLLGHGATPVGAVAGGIGAAMMIRSQRSAGERRDLTLLLATSAIVLVQFLLLAAGKPGEYARLAIVPSIVLGISLAVWIGRARIRSFEKIEALAVVLVLAILQSTIYLRGYSRDAGPDPRRLEYAHDLDQLRALGARTIGVLDEPAPYLLPPVDLFEWHITLLPPDFGLAGADGAADVVIRPVDRLDRAPREIGGYVLISQRTIDDLFPSRISWAAKPIEIWARAELIRLPATRPE